ncbi:MAG: recombinase family protein [Chloroflexi bacterium]|jgi:site-specific DNA recombinase|nr:recombinase family protein [Chloroflexota bacterium]MBT5627617.1 recombinase family protein [Chloroflexota bacterium]
MVTTISHKKYVGYIRVSGDKQVGEGHSSLETQESRIRAIASEDDGLVVRLFQDVQSGRRDDRIEYQSMVKYVLEEDVDVVLVQYLDRFGRNPQEILQRIWELKAHGVSVEATDQDIEDELILLVLAGVAGHESKRTSERVRANMGNIVKRGIHSGQKPFGFSAVREIVDGRARVVSWEIEESEAEIIREMARLSTEENLGFKAISDSLNERGLQRATGHWVPSSVQHILRNPVLKGVMVYGRRPKTGNPKGEVIEVPGVFPSILSDAEWDALQQRMDIRKKVSRGSSHKSDYLLSGIARCGHCGGPMTGKSGSAYKGRRYTSYVCTRAVRAREGCAFYNGHASKKLETAVLEYLGQFSDPKRVAELLSESSKSDLVRSKRELKRLEKKLVGLDSDFQKNLEYLKKDLLNEEEFGAANVQRRDERAKTQIRLAELREALAKAEAAKESTSALPDQISSFLKSFESLEVRKAKAILQTILDEAHIWRDGKIELKFR